jgi:hypothetical protein
MHVLLALPNDVTGQCMQLLHGLCCFDFVSDIPLSPATLICCGFSSSLQLTAGFPNKDLPEKKTIRKNDKK